MDYPDSVRFLYSLGNEARTARLGLGRMAALVEALGQPQDAFRIVHVAGTNGKGSTCAMIDSGLRAAGVRTGLFTSPHLVEPLERIRVDGAPVRAGEFTAAFEEVHAAAERLIAEGLADCHPTYFETVTAMAFVIFRAAGVHTSVIEVGLGGRLDATNVVMPVLSVITPIDFDHEAYLGKSLESIASEKAGILKPGVPAVLAAQRPEADAVLLARAAEQAAPVHRTAEWSVEQLALDRWGSRFLASGPARIPIECPLAGEHQVANAVTAACALSNLGVPAEAIAEGIRSVRWPGRLECVSRRPEIILDGAHNPSGARALADYIRRFFAGRRVRLIYGAMRDKAVAEVAGILFPLADEVVITAPRLARAVRPETVRSLVDHPRVRVAGTLEQALEHARPEEAETTTFITGSLFLVGEARALLVQ